MRCPICEVELDYQVDPSKGTHAEYDCPCGAFLQWDQSVESTDRPGQMRIGPPRPCGHKDLKKPDAKVPLV